MNKFLRSISVFAAAAMLLPSFMGFHVEAATGVKIDSSHFPDANFRAVVKGYDTDKNGYLSDAEISVVRNVSCEGKGIKKLNGIEYFTAVQGLWCANNSISSMDVSQNTDLRGVWCSGNPLTELNFSNNKELTWVYCFDCKLTSLDFSNNPKLAYLECNTNKGLNSLNLTKNKELEHLMCGSCALTTLDLSPNPNLCHLDAFRNNMTSINISKNTKLKRLNIWDNPELGNVSVSHLPELQYYNCAKNGVTKIDVTHNPQLQELVVAWNYLTELDLSKNPRLAYLRCNDNQLDELDISHNPQLYYLEAFINNFTKLNIGNNSRLINVVQKATKKSEPNVAGYSYLIDYGGAQNEFGVDLRNYLCVGNKCKTIETTANNPQDLPDSTTDTKDGLTESDDLMTREMVIQTLYELAGKPGVSKLKTTFTDVDKGAWYENAIKWGQNKKIALGYPNFCSDEFGVGEYVTRQDLALMLHRYATAFKYKTAFDYGRTDWFDDFSKIDYYAWGPFTWAIQWEYLSPKNSGKNAYPRGRVSRAELETAIKEMLSDNGRTVPSKIPIPPSDVRDLVKVQAKAATCTEDGNTAYWQSKTSGKYYKDAMGKTEIPENSWNIPKLGHAMTHVNEKAATCTAAGNIEYYKCTRCLKFFTDENGAGEISKDDITVPATGHDPVKTEAAAESCTEDGNSEYWTCNNCGKYYADENCEQEIKKDSWVIPAGHKGVDKITPATFDKNGRVLTTCSVCKDTIRDEEIPHIAEVRLKATEATYTGSSMASLVQVTDANGKTVSSEHYTLIFKDSAGNEIDDAKDVGEYSVIVKFKNFYKGTSEEMAFKVNKKANTLKIKSGKKYKVKYSKIRKKKKVISYSSVISFSSKGQGTLTFTKKSGNKKITISKGGKVTIKKKLRKGTYKVKVKVKAAGNGNYKPSSVKTVTFKIKVY